MQYSDYMPPRSQQGHTWIVPLADANKIVAHLTFHFALVRF